MPTRMLSIISDNYFYIQGIVSNNLSCKSYSPEDVTGINGIDFKNASFFLVHIKNNFTLIEVLQRLSQECSCTVFIDYVTPSAVDKFITVRNFCLIFNNYPPQIMLQFIYHFELKLRLNSFSAANLSPTEQRILWWIVNGVDNQYIARRMNITTKMVSHYKLKLANKMSLPEVNNPTLIGMMKAIYHTYSQQEHGGKYTK